MQVITRNNQNEPVKLDKISDRIKKLCYGLSDIIDPVIITTEICSQIKDKIKTTELDELSSSVCLQKIMDHPDYEILASRISINNYHKETSGDFTEVINIAKNNKDSTGTISPLVSQKLVDIVNQHGDEINSWIDYSRDFNLNCFGFKTLQRSYLLKTSDYVPIERPGDLFMRVSLGIHNWDNDGKDAKETYDYMTNGKFIHATPTLFNSGTPHPQMSSCFLMGMEDSVKGIFEALGDTAMISKHSGGIGIHIHDVRGNGSYIRSTAGKSNGIFPLLKVFNDTARYINQGGKRNGSFAMYLEPHHPDIIDFLESKKPQGVEDCRARDLFYALWISDLFMKRVEEDGDWCLFCPDACPGLSNVWGDEYTKLYTKYEESSLYVNKIKARDIWEMIINSQIETGGPYMLYKDAVNKKSNQQNIGTIKSSNLCCEIMQYSDNKEYAVCNLASIALPKLVDEKTQTFDYTELRKITKIIVKNLNKIIDRNYYPLEKARVSNMKHRPIGVGVQGLADAFLKMGYAFESPEAKQLNSHIFQHIYYAAVEASHELALTEGSYDTFEGSPMSKGIFQFDMWDTTPEAETGLDWECLREKIKKCMRNSLLIAPMPTASTSQILGCNECFEPFTSNLFTRRTLAGEFVVINTELIRKLLELNMWNEKMKSRIILNKGSVQNIMCIPDYIKVLFKTAWEMKQKTLLDMSVDRGKYICQSQSLNVFVENPTFKILNSIHMYGWKSGLKTGTYYIRTKAASKAQTFAIDPELQKQIEQEDRDQVCAFCSG